MTDTEGPKGISRASFLGGATGVAGAVALGMAPQAGARSGRARTSQSGETKPGVRTRSSARPFLELGATAVPLQSATGGAAVGSVQQTGDRKGIADVRYEPIELVVALGTADPLLEWAAESWAGEAGRRSGAIVYVDFDRKVHTRLEFSDAVVTETRLSRLDANAREEATVAMTITAAMTRRSSGTGDTFEPRGQGSRRSPASEFRLSIEGLSTQRVVAIEELGVKLLDSGPDKRSTAKRPAPLVSDLRVVIAPGHALSFAKWFDDFVVAGNNGPAAEKGGVLEFLSPDLRERVATLVLEGLGIFRFAPLVSESEGGVRHAADMYVQRIRIMR